MNIYMISGPNLNMLGKRDSKLYGSLTLEELYQLILESFPDHRFSFYQSNHEGQIIDMIHALSDEPYDALIINPGGYTHTSIAIRDALELLSIPKIEVHLSNIEKREQFRKTDLIKDVCDQRFMGKKEKSYIEAIEYIIKTYQR